jgi:hypothetical protein
MLLSRHLLLRYLVLEVGESPCARGHFGGTTKDRSRSKGRAFVRRTMVELSLYMAERAS